MTFKGQRETKHSWEKPSYIVFISLALAASLCENYEIYYVENSLLFC